MIVSDICLSSLVSLLPLDASVSSTPKELCQSNAAQAPAAPSKSPQDSEAAKDGNNNVRPVTRTTNPPVIKPAASADKAPKTEESCLANGGGNGAPDQLPAVAEVKVPVVDTKASKQQQPNGAVKSSANVVPTSSNPMSSSVGVAAGPVTTSVPSGVLSYAQVAQREKDLGAGDGEKEGVVVKDNNSSATVNASGGKKEKKEAAGAGE